MDQIMDSIMVLDLSTITDQQLGFPRSQLFASIINGLVAAGDFFNGLTGGALPGPLPRP
jgi:hypothetical protein